MIWMIYLMNLTMIKLMEDILDGYILKILQKETLDLNSQLLT